MNVLKIAVCGLGALVVLSLPARAQGWRGIMPMKSTCNDVKRIMGVGTCAPPDGTYDLGEEKVKIRFSKGPCEPAYQKFWDVPVGTVIIIERHLQKRIPLADFHIEESKYKKSYNDHIGHVVYSSEEEGVEYWTLNGDVYLIIYMPGVKASHLECPKGKVPHSRSKRGKS